MVDQKELQEKLAKMSPAELRDWQKQQCIFCHIVQGKIPAKKVYEDEHCIAILDINPAYPGHILLLPKEHYPLLPTLPDQMVTHLINTAKRLSHVLLKTMQVNGTTIMIQNGSAAGQRAQHLMIHIIPRKDNDGVTITLPKKRIPLEKRKEILEFLKTGKKPDELIEKVSVKAKEAEKTLDEIDKELKEDNKRLEEKAGKPDLDAISNLFK